MDVSRVRWDAAGLVTVVVQERLGGEVRMVAHADRAALERTLETGEGWLFSRSRNALWKKGETSGNTLLVREVWVDCDGDAVVYLVDSAGPSCHTGERACFFERLDAPRGDARTAVPVLGRLGDALEARRDGAAQKSYTRSLLDAGPAAIGEKIREEAGELAAAIADESDERVVSEAADVVYHALVGLLARGLSIADVERELARRFGTSGHEEKASR
jgi:phosphoribosyl-ATP pyrophosphohydrolase/phosphoribosyl-AMP cyclohydrolase